MCIHGKKPEFTNPTGNGESTDHILEGFKIQIQELVLRVEDIEAIKEGFPVEPLSTEYKKQTWRTKEQVINKI